METEQIKINHCNKRVQINFDASQIETDLLINFFRRFETEYLTQKANFNIEILELADEIDRKWWNENSTAFLNGVVL